MAVAGKIDPRFEEANNARDILTLRLAGVIGLPAKDVVDALERWLDARESAKRSGY